MLAYLKIISPSLEHYEEICNLLVESITMNCAGDYNNDPEIMEEWLANKTPDNVSQWINSPNNISLVALNTLKNRPIGFILMNKNGEILLNYVLSSYIYKGVGKRLLTKMEKAAKKEGINTLLVVSTITAKKFYERNGFIKNGEPEYVGTILGDFPLIKHLNIA